MKNLKGKATIILMTMIVLVTSVVFSGCNVKKIPIQNKDNTTTTTEQKTVSTTEPTTTNVVETTTQKPKPDYSKAYKAYKTVLKQNAFEIKDYDYQNKEDESRQIAFADILGDDTPELIFTRSEIYNEAAGIASDNNSDKDTKVTLNIYTYSNGQCKKVSYKGQDEFGLQTSTQNGYFPYMIYQQKNDKNLYIFTQHNFVGNVCKIYKLTTEDCKDNQVFVKELMNQTKYSEPNQYQQNEGTINGKDVGYDKCEKYKYDNLNNMKTLLLYSDKLDDNYGDYYSPEKCKGMSYEEAMNFLNKYDNTDNDVDYSVIAGVYNLRKNGYGSVKLEIATDGTFKSLSGNFTNTPFDESICHGVIKNLTKVSENKYTFNCGDTVLNNEPGTSEERTYKGMDSTVEYIDNPFNTDEQLVLYTEGTPLSEMDKADYDSHVSWPSDGNEKTLDNKIIFIENASTDGTISTYNSIYDYRSSTEY